MNSLVTELLEIAYDGTDRLKNAKPISLALAFKTLSDDMLSIDHDHARVALNLLKLSPGPVNPEERIERFKKIVEATGMLHLEEEQALELSKVVKNYSRGGVSRDDVEDALIQLSRIPQSNVRENVLRFRHALNSDEPLSGLTSNEWMLRAAMGIESSLENFVNWNYGEDEEVP